LITPKNSFNLIWFLIEYINNGTNSNSFSYTPADGDVVTCDMTSSATCAGSGSSMSNEIIMIVNPLPDTGEIIPD
jgi:hypothetical protein